MVDKIFQEYIKSVLLEPLTVLLFPLFFLASLYSGGWVVAGVLLTSLDSRLCSSAHYGNPKPTDLPVGFSEGYKTKF